MFTFSPLLGALSESSASQSILELDGGIKILVGLGWDESFDVAKLKELEKYVPPLSLSLSLSRTIPGHDHTSDGEGRPWSATSLS